MLCLFMHQVRFYPNLFKGRKEDYKVFCLSKGNKILLFDFSAFRPDDMEIIRI